MTKLHIGLRMEGADELIKSSRSNAVREASLLTQDALELTNHPEPAKYEGVTESLARCADLLARVGERLESQSELKKEPPL